jgi:RNA polymerase sigma-70 factor, ECF subfamily
MRIALDRSGWRLAMSGMAYVYTIVYSCQWARGRGRRPGKKVPARRRSAALRSDDVGVSGQPTGVEDLPSGFLAFYDDAVPQVYGYLVARCGTRAVAEDLTAETFLAAVDAVRRVDPPAVSMPWIIGVARHKLVDHWRRLSRETSGLRALVDRNETEQGEDLSEKRLDAVRAHQTLSILGTHHRIVLTLRYLDDLSVPEVASVLGRTVHATEALLSRARRAFRRAYDANEDSDEEIQDG